MKTRNAILLLVIYVAFAAFITLFGSHDPLMIGLRQFFGIAQ